MPPVSCDAALQLEGILFVVGDGILDVCADVSLNFIETHQLELGRSAIASEQHKGHHRSVNYTVRSQSYITMAEIKLSWVALKSSTTV